MFDCHYDLLTHILMRKNEKDYLKEYCYNVYNQNNITGGIFNLFYMSKKEMYEELGMHEKQINIIDNLREVKEFIESNSLIPNNIDYIFGIEGLDYLENIDDIDTLYSLGLRATNPVWSNQNKFGGGVKASSKIGLTQIGKELILKLIQKNIAIDLSHANETTFFDIIKICKNEKEKGKSPIVFVSHSNVKNICNVERNLTDEQILAIKDLDGIIGIVSIKMFCVNTTDFCNPMIDFEKQYINNINYIKNLLGNVNNICVATDDMKYYTIEPDYYQNINIYSHSNICKKLRKALKDNNYNNYEIECILENNFKEKILKKL